MLRSVKESISILKEHSYLYYVYIIGLILTFFKIIVRYNINHKQNSIIVLSDGSFIVLTIFMMIAITIDTGTLNLLKCIFLKEETSIDEFTDGIKIYFWKMFFGNVLIGTILTLFLLPLIGLYIHKPVLGGLLLFLSIASLSIFLIMWDIIMIFEDRSITDSLWQSIEFGKQNSAKMFLLGCIIFIFAGNQISSYISEMVIDNNNISNFSLLYDYLSNIVSSNTMFIIFGTIAIRFFQLFFKIVLFNFYSNSVKITPIDEPYFAYLHKNK